MPYGTVNADLITTSDGVSYAGLYGFKNRLINSDMRIDQRNAGASVTVNTATDTYGVDRWLGAGVVTDGVFTMQQDSSAPTGFSNSLKITVTTADTSVTGAQSYQIQQKIEGFNTSDLGFGTASAATITLSFWVRSSLTGTFGGALVNSAFNRSYPFSYTISAANTWEQKSVTIAGDTSGTWIGSTNGIGLRVYFGLGAADRAGTAGAWAGAGYVTATGAVSVIGTLNATFYVTGVQLERGSAATSFDYRPYGTELQLCQRYLPAWNMTAANQIFGQGQVGSGSSAVIHLPFKVSARVAPTGITASAAANFYLTNSTYNIAGTYSSTVFGYGSTEGIGLTCSTSTGLTAGNITTLGANSATAQILATGCEL
ncbi:hypothetical protein UFOVP684_57 [uncultured Caudovirales phage]|uniref:Uncharacterized protein n=1 Tax=uncultured Caudovirales phage TaxID=2100421 RepID=A0A6J5NJN4_9CAUD|nr:hypothetical protein UFOVP409_45 [uncultured Caudovirales phage]CAB4157946.1 hypothetical protein UFOVP684_57 [uncultured Caudovirales phage]